MSDERLWADCSYGLWNGVEVRLDKIRRQLEGRVEEEDRM